MVNTLLGQNVPTNTLLLSITAASVHSVELMADGPCSSSSTLLPARRRYLTSSLRVRLPPAADRRPRFCRRFATVVTLNKCVTGANKSNGHADRGPAFALRILGPDSDSATSTRPAASHAHVVPPVQVPLQHCEFCVQAAPVARVPCRQHFPS